MKAKTNIKYSSNSYATVLQKAILKFIVTSNILLITLVLSLTTAIAERNHEDLELSVPWLDSIESSKAFYERAGARVPCAVEIAAYYSCLDEHPQYNLGYDCYSYRTIVKQCFNKLEKRKNDLCKNIYQQYQSALQWGNSDNAHYILYSTPEISYSRFLCDWQKNERLRVEKQQRCNSTYQNFMNKVDRGDISFAEKLLYDNKDCEWFDKGWKTIKAKKYPTEGYASSSNPRPSYSTSGTKSPTVIYWNNGQLRSEIFYHSNGKKEQEKQYNSKGILVLKLYYDTNGRTKQKQTYWTNGAGLAKIVDFPANGGKPKVTCYNQDGSRRTYNCSP